MACSGAPGFVGGWGRRFAAPRRRTLGARRLDPSHPTTFGRLFSRARAVEYGWLKQGNDDGQQAGRETVGKVEREMLEAIVRLVQELGRGVTEEEALSAIIPPDQPRLRFKPSYKHCFERLGRRGLLEGTTRDSSDGWRVVPSAWGLVQLGRERPSD
jgi:hypothetical protein